MREKPGLRLMLVAAVLALLSPAARGQGNIDWEELWIIHEPPAANEPYGWMFGAAQYTGLAYDKWRDAVYVVNPGQVGSPPNLFLQPKIHILDARTGVPRTDLGRALNGQGGELAVPTDTVKGGYSNGRFSIYRIDLDDEGRIFVCNLVSPVQTSNTYKLYRWDSARATPKLVYSGGTEMGSFRWGDAFDVVGKRTWVSSPGVWRDSVRIFTSGGVSAPTAPLNNQVDIFLADTRTSPAYDYRLGIKAVMSNSLLASHGLAVTGPGQFADIWMDNNTRVTTRQNQVQSGAALPQTYTMTANYSISGDTVTGTAASGAIAFVSIPTSSITYLVCADGLPSFPGDTSAVNYHTRARLIDLSQLGNETRPPGFDNTPHLGFHSFDQSGGESNYIADIDYKLEPDSLTGDLHIVLFVLMSGNGIAAYRSRQALYLNVPVELQSFTARRESDAVRLDWRTATETNNLGFAVERSVDEGGAWTVLGFVPGNGTTTRQSEYRFTDPLAGLPPGARRAAYRLRQTDTDGKTTVSHHAEVALDGSPAAISLAQNFPNPCVPATTITYSVFEPGVVRLSLYNSSGAELRTLAQGYRTTGAYTVDVDLNALPAGVYQYILESGSHRECRSMVVLR
jgi:hypothetical protein